MYIFLFCYGQIIKFILDLDLMQTNFEVSWFIFFSILLYFIYFFINIINSLSMCFFRQKRMKMIN